MFPMSESESAWASQVLTHCTERYPVRWPTDPTTIAWVAGLVEGEGCFAHGKNSPTISIQMCDQDVIQHVAAALGISERSPWQYPGRKGGYKKVYHCCILGARAIVWMVSLYPFLGSRRRAKVREIVERWMLTGRPKAPRGTRWAALCHPDKPRVADGLCHRCYMRRYRQRRKQEGTPHPSESPAVTQQ